MVKLSALIKTINMYEYVRIVVVKESIKESIHKLYEGTLGNMPLMTYMQIKDMSVYCIEIDSIEEEEDDDCTTFFNITVNEVE